MAKLDPTIARNSRYGLILFLVYVLLYAGFVALAAFDYHALETQVLGINLAIAYGLFLIFAAFVLAGVYTYLCRSEGAGKKA